MLDFVCEGLVEYGCEIGVVLEVKYVIYFVSIGFVFVFLIVEELWVVGWVDGEFFFVIESFELMVFGELWVFGIVVFYVYLIEVKG